MEISRNLLAGALGALGKLVSRTSPVEAYRSVLIEGKENKISFRTAGSEESVTFTMDCEDARMFRIAVNFDDSAIRTAETLSALATKKIREINAKIRAAEGSRAFPFSGFSV